MLKVFICSGLLAGVFLPAAVPAQAAESGRSNVICETGVEVAGAVVGYGIARRSGLKELGRTVGSAVGDKIASKSLTSRICGTGDDKNEKTGAAAPPAHPWNAGLPEHKAPDYSTLYDRKLLDHANFGGVKLPDNLAAGGLKLPDSSARLGPKLRDPVFDGKSVLDDFRPKEDFSTFGGVKLHDYSALGRHNLTKPCSWCLSPQLRTEFPSSFVKGVYEESGK